LKTTINSFRNLSSENDVFYRKSILFAALAPISIEPKR